MSTSVTKENEDELKVKVSNPSDVVLREVPGETKHEYIVQQYLLLQDSHSGEGIQRRARLKVTGGTEAGVKVGWWDQTKQARENSEESQVMNRTESSQAINQSEFQTLITTQEDPEAELIKKLRLKFPATVRIDSYNPDIEIDIFLQPIVPSCRPLILGEVEMDRLDLDPRRFLPGWMDWEVTTITNYEIACGEFEKLW